MRNEIWRKDFRDSGIDYLAMCEKENIAPEQPFTAATCTARLRSKQYGAG